MYYEKSQFGMNFEVNVTFIYISLLATSLRPSLTVISSIYPSLPIPFGLNWMSYTLISCGFKRAALQLCFTAYDALYICNLNSHQDRTLLLR